MFGDRVIVAQGQYLPGIEDEMSGIIHVLAVEEIDHAGGDHAGPGFSGFRQKCREPLGIDFRIVVEQGYVFVVPGQDNSLQ